jgi:hypothetical protein
VLLTAQNRGKDTSGFEIHAINAGINTIIVGSKRPTEMERKVHKAEGT